MPIPAGAGQSAHLDAEDQPHVIEGDLSQEPLETRSSLGRLAAPAQVLIDDEDTRARPAQGDGPADQVVLQRRRLGMLDDLLRGGLGDVDDRQSLAMSCLDLARTPEW